MTTNKDVLKFVVHTFSPFFFRGGGICQPYQLACTLLYNSPVSACPVAHPKRFQDVLFRFHLQSLHFASVNLYHYETKDEAVVPSLSFVLNTTTSFTTEAQRKSHLPVPKWSKLWLIVHESIQSSPSDTIVQILPIACPRSYYRTGSDSAMHLLRRKIPYVDIYCVHGEGPRSKKKQTNPCFHDPVRFPSAFLFRSKTHGLVMAPEIGLF